MSHQQSFISEIPLDVLSEMRVLDALAAIDDRAFAKASDRPDFNVVNTAIEAMRIAQEAYTASCQDLKTALESQGYELRCSGGYEDTNYHMVHHSVPQSKLDYWGNPEDGVDPSLVVPV